MAAWRASNHVLRSNTCPALSPPAFPSEPASQRLSSDGKAANSDPQKESISLIPRHTVVQILIILVQGYVLQLVGTLHGVFLFLFKFLPQTKKSLFPKQCHVLQLMASRIKENRSGNHGAAASSARVRLLGAIVKTVLFLL